jgi:putative transposase
MVMVTEMRLRAAAEGGVRFNYRGHHRYMITLPAAGPEVCLSEEKTVLAILAALRESSRTHQFEVYAYCFLPDRLAVIVRGKSEESDPLWARRYQERVLRKTENTRTVAEEVFRLPVRAGIVTSPSAYQFQGSFVLPSEETPRRAPRPPSRRPSGKRDIRGGSARKRRSP